MKAKLLLAIAVLVLTCTACAGAAAAPEPTPTKTPRAVPLPTPAGTPDPVWNTLQAGLWKNVWVCLKSERQFEAHIPTGMMIAVNFHWVTMSDGIRIHTVRVVEETLKREDLGEFEIFLFDSLVDLDGFERVVVHIEIGNREFEFWFPVEMCPPLVEQSSL